MSGVTCEINKRRDD